MMYNKDNRILYIYIHIYDWTRQLDETALRPDGRTLRRDRRDPRLTVTDFADVRVPHAGDDVLV